VAVDALRHLPKQRFGGVARGLFGFAGSAKGGLGGLEVAQFGLEVVAGVGQRVRSAATSPKVAKFAFSTEMKLFIHARKSASFGGMYSRAIVSPRGFLSSLRRHSCRIGDLIVGSSFLSIGSAFLSIGLSIVLMGLRIL
jgi:hypothetical protein